VTEYQEIVAYHLEQAYRYREELGPIDDDSRALARRAAEHLKAAADRANPRGDVRAARTLLERAAALLPEGDPLRLSIQPGLGSALFESGEIERAHAFLTQTVEQADSVGDRSASAWARIVLMEVEASRPTRSQAELIAETEDLIREFESLGDELGVAQASTVAGQYLFFQGQARDAEAMLSAARDRAIRSGVQEQALVATWWIFAALFFGPTPVSEAEERLRSLGDIVQASRTAEAAYRRSKARFAWVQGRFDEAREHLRAWADLERELGRATRVASLEGHYVGPLEAAAGRYGAAIEAYRRGFEAQRAQGDVGYSSTVAGDFAHALLEIGDLDEAERYARIALETSIADDIEPQMSGGGALAVVLARRGEIEEALTRAEEAVAVARRTDYSMNLAEVLVDLGHVLAAARRHDEAKAAVDEAVEILERKEAWALVERAREAGAALF
jgi:tetratricopeptide (TPR) repeat protein